MLGNTNRYPTVNPGFRGSQLGGAGLGFRSSLVSGPSSLAPRRFGSFGGSRP